MTERSLQVTWRKGRAFAEYLSCSASLDEDGRHTVAPWVQGEPVSRCPESARGASALS